MSSGRCVEATVHISRHAATVATFAALVATSGGARVDAATDGRRDLGEAASASTMTISVMLGYRHEAELESLVYDQGDATSPAFRHYLTRPQFDAYFSPDVAQYERVATALRTNGFTVDRASSNRLLVRASSTVSNIERTFSTRIHRNGADGIAARGGGARAATRDATRSDRHCRVERRPAGTTGDRVG
jgi:hypothetical protein